VDVEQIGLMMAGVRSAKPDVRAQGAPVGAPEGDKVRD
jgi:hypothetical protein